MPSPHEKRSVAMKMIRNTLIRVAEQDDTINKITFIGEIMRMFEVSEFTAVSYIKELKSMGLVNERDGMIWHSKEEDIRNKYLIENGQK